jgi:hypothetical protein
MSNLYTNVSGFAGGGWFDDTGASAEPVCLPPDPEFGRTSAGDSGRMYGAEFDENFSIRMELPKTSHVLFVELNWHQVLS